MKRLFGWTLWFLLLLLSAYIVPYTLLTDIPKVKGAFLYWCLFAIVAGLSIERVTSTWRDV